MRIALVNSFATLEFEKLHKIDLSKLRAPGIRRKSRRFTGKATMTFNGYTAMVYASGKVTVVGLKDLSKLNETIPTEIQRFLRQQGYQVEITGHRVRNHVFCGNLDKTIPLDDSYRKLLAVKPIDGTWRIIYEYDQYPAIRLSVAGQGTAVIYGSGKVIVSGAADYNMGHAFCEKMLSLLDTV